MKDKIKQAILDILSEKRANGDVLPFATIFEVTATNVKSGHTKSCGCVRIENNKKRHQL